MKNLRAFITSLVVFGLFFAATSAYAAGSTSQSAKNGCSAHVGGRTQSIIHCGGSAGPNDDSKSTPVTITSSGGHKHHHYHRPHHHFFRVHHSFHHHFRCVRSSHGSHGGHRSHGSHGRHFGHH